MHPRHLLMATLLAGLVGAAGCGGADEDICQAAASHLGTCFGSTAANAYARRQVCDPVAADRLLSLDCRTLGLATSGGKMDDLGLDDAMKGAIQEAIREKVLEAIKAALSQVLSSLAGGMLDKYDFYIMLDRTTFKSSATSKASSLAAALSAVPGMQPTVVKLEWGYGVVHGPCPVSLSTDLPERIADVVAGKPELIKALGGSITTSSKTSEGCQPAEPSPPSSSGCWDPDDPDCADSYYAPPSPSSTSSGCGEQQASISVHLPLKLYGVPRSYDWPQDLGCHSN